MSGVDADRIPFACPPMSAMPKGVPQASGERVPEPVMDVEHVARAVLQMASLPLDTNVQLHDDYGDPHAVHRAWLDRYSKRERQA